ncbi:MAG TPA: hypothetical protein VKT72_06370 [Candidatus Baltobacteraceae bacterium]|nr:hypothetical protein [Candidatus Baltobacteraceae bacterium]
MHYFVEYLRALRSMRVVGIILGVLLLMAIIARLTTHLDQPGTYFGNLEKSPTAHVTRTTLPDGSVRTVLVDPARNIHAVSVVRGVHLHIDIVEPSSARKSETDHFSAANFSVSDVDKKGGMEHIVVNTNQSGDVPVGILLLTSIIMGFVVASMLGGVLSKENDGHLELAWTKPISREQYAVSAFGVDLVAIVVSQLLWCVMALLALLLFFMPHLTWEKDAALHIGLAFLGPISWYAALNGWSASVKRGPGVVIGLGWLFGWMVPGIAAATGGVSYPLVAAIHVVAQAVSYIDPLTYVGFHSSGIQVSAVNNAGSEPIRLAVSVAALAALTILYLALAVAQWRRVEA